MMEDQLVNAYGLPSEAPCSWSNERLFLRYPIPINYKGMTIRPFGIYWSDALSYGRLWPEPTEAELANFYSTPEYNRYLSGNSTSRSGNISLISRVLVKIAWLNDKGIADPLPTIISIGNKFPEVCDLGCGAGDFLSRMRDHGAKPTGVDPSPVSGKALGLKQIEFYLGKADALPSALVGRQFDVVTMFHSLEHCRDPALAVANAASLLKPNGLLVIEVPNMECRGFEKYGPVWWHTDAGRHLQFLTKGSLSKLIALVGLEPIKWEYMGFVTQFTPSWIDDMAAVWDRSFDGSSDGPTRPSLFSCLYDLPRALLSNASKKYEIIRVYARPYS